MAKYGNILTIFNPDQNSHSNVEKVLKIFKADYKKLKDTYFLESNSKQNTGDIIRDLNGINVEFIFFHNNISDGSLIKSNKIDDKTIKEINRIMLK